MRWLDVCLVAICGLGVAFALLMLRRPGWWPWGALLLVVSAVNLAGVFVPVLEAWGRLGLAVLGALSASDEFRKARASRDTDPQKVRSARRAGVVWSVLAVLAAADFVRAWV